MGFRDKFKDQYTQTYLNKYGDRLTQVQGKILSVKIERKTILWIFHKISVTLLVKAVNSKNITKCSFNKKRFFKKIDFIDIKQGHSVLIQGLKGKKGKEHREVIDIMNVMNMTTKQDLVPIEGGQQNIKKLQNKMTRRYK